MTFSHLDKAVIHSTASELDGIEVVIIGVAVEDAVATHYIIQRTEGKLFSNGYSAIQLTEHCLCKPFLYRSY